VVIALVENLRGNIVGSAELLVKVTVGIVDEGSTEIDDLNLVELFVLLKQDILGFEIAMHDVGLMAIVDAAENLLHEDGSITLAELAALKDLVEELTALADLRNEVVALLILKELVHLDDVGVILKREKVSKGKNGPYD